MKKLNRGDKIYIDKEKKEESYVNEYLSCRDGIIEVYEYMDFSGYGSETRLFFCQNTKHEHISIIRQTYNSLSETWDEEIMTFDTDSFSFLKAIINNKKDQLGGEYTEVRDY